MPNLLLKSDQNTGKSMYWVDADTKKRWAGRQQDEDGNWYIYGSDGTKTLVGKNKYNFEGIQTTNNRSYNPEYLNIITKALENLPINQRSTVVGNIIEESGGDPLKTNGTFQGLLQWDKDRYRLKSNDPQKEIDNQLNYLYQTKDNTTDRKSWTDGGKGSGFMTGKESHQTFVSDKSSLPQTHRAFTFSYVRPSNRAKTNQERLEVVQQVYPRIINTADSVSIGLLPKSVIGQ